MNGGLVWLVRHGAADVRPGVAIGASDPPLSEAGREQAERLAQALSCRPLARVVSSDLGRATATAAAIAAPHGLAVETTAALREIDFGAWEGRPLSELWRESPQEAAAWGVNLRATPASFGERFDDLEERVLEFWRRREGEASLGPGRGDDVVVVAHRGTLVVLLAAIWRVPIERAWRWRCSVGTAVAVSPC